MPVDNFIEWLAEWGDVRRRQHGLLLLTAHGAKGLEFDHVVVLDGGWGRAGRDEDADAPRRLYYVAMTRARQTLTLVRFDGSRPGPGASQSSVASECEGRGYAGRLHSLANDVLECPSVLRRPPGGVLPDAPELARQYWRPGLDAINLGFVGRHHRRHPVHPVIARLSPGERPEAKAEERGR